MAPLGQRVSVFLLAWLQANPGELDVTILLATIEGIYQGAYWACRATALKTLKVSIHDYSIRNT